MKKINLFRNGDTTKKPYSCAQEFEKGSSVERSLIEGVIFYDKNDPTKGLIEPMEFFDRAETNHEYAASLVDDQQTKAVDLGIDANLVTNFNKACSNNGCTQPSTAVIPHNVTQNVVQQPLSYGQMPKREIYNGYHRFERPKSVKSIKQYEIKDETDCCYITNGQESVLFSNFNANITSVDTYIYRDDPEKQSVNGTVHISNYSEAKKLNYSNKDFRNLANHILLQYADTYINEDIYGGEKRFTNHIRKKANDAPKRTIYKNHGWQDINGRKVYVHDGIAQHDLSVRFETDKTIKTSGVDKYTAQRKSLSLLNLSDDKEVILPIYLMHYLAVLNALFEEAGAPPKFITYVCGPTGTFKTEISKQMFRIFEEDVRSSVNSFKGTLTSLEVSMNESYDCIFLVDDLHAESNTELKGNIEFKKESVCRYFGDDVGHERSNQELSKAKTLKPRGICAMTAEYVSGSKSSNLRCLFIETKEGCIKSEELSKLQSDHTLLSDNLAYFLDYVAYNYNNIVSFIANESRKLTQLYCTFKEKRSTRTCVSLLITAKIVDVYLNAGGAFCDKYAPVLVSAVSKSESISETQGPEYVYLSAIHQMILSKRMKIGKFSKKFDFNLSGYVNFESRQLLLNPDETHKMVRYYLKDQGHYNINGKLEIYRLLYSKELIEVQGDGSGKINYCKRTSLEGRPRFLAINIDKMEELLDEDLWSILPH
ncbi:MAG: hypothetical protein R3Y09_01320 [Clostridia bacterium]